ncbi:MAG: DUF4783 domain-containing protein [Bacteroidales bacterium]|nr:DUF4783 domain-containing protein [Bacteroidales bacterium]
MVRKAVISLLSLFAALALCSAKGPQNSNADVFVPIAKYIQKGDADKLSAWFASNLEVEIFSNATECSRAQAKQIIKNFFEQYPPKSFSILHKSGNPPMKYAIGTLSAGGENLRVVLLVRTRTSSSEILRIRIERSAR